MRTRTVTIHVTLPRALLSMNKDITRDIIKLNACTRDLAGDIFTHESTTCSMGEGNHEDSRGDEGQTWDRQMGNTSVIEIACTDPLYILHTR